MASAILAICGERYKGGWHVRRYAYPAPMEEGDRIADSRLCLETINRLSGETSTWRVNEEPPPGLQRFIDVILTIVNHGKTGAKYSVDRHAYPKAPEQAIADGMAIERDIRKMGINPANATETRRSKAREAERKAKKEAFLAEQKRLDSMPRFKEGVSYTYRSEDRFGHIENKSIMVLARKDSDGVVEVKGVFGKKYIKIQKESDGSEFLYLKSEMKRVFAKDVTDQTQGD